MPDLTDLADPASAGADTAPARWARLRTAGPVHRVERPDGEPFWAVVAHDVALAVLRDTTTFSSQAGMRLDDHPAAVRAAAGRMLIVTDPPRHGAVRRIVNAAFTPRMVARLRETMRRTAAEAVDAALERGACDFTDVAALLPVSVICDLLGVPRADWPFMLDRTRTAFGGDPSAAAAAHADILLYYVELVARRRREPGDDVVTALVQGRVDGAPLSDDEIFLNCDGLVSGGNETTRHATVGGLLALMANPGAWTALRDRPDRIATAVPEILRWTSPAMHVLRTATVDTELAGRRVAAGDRVAVWLPAANRDPEVFADPESFLVTRTPNRHLTFGQGAHHCLGAALAGMELSVMFEEVLRLVEAAEPAGAPRRLRSNLIWGYERAPVVLTRRADVTVGAGQADAHGG